MPKILIVTGSARTGRVADKVLPLVQANLESIESVQVELADVGELGLPFFDSEHAPSSPDFHPTNSQVMNWTKQVADADGVLFLVPEYNHTMTAIQKNAIDWIFQEWQAKPVGFVGYGWVGGERAITTARIVLGNVQATILPTVSMLRFMKELNIDGTALDADQVKALVSATVAELVDASTSD